MPLNYLMDEKFRNLPLRNGVGIIVLNQQNKIFVAKRIDNPKDFWQMPQGGVDNGEKPIDAAYRELEEETGMKNLEFIKEIEGTTMYELPEHLLGIIFHDFSDVGLWAVHFPHLVVASTREANMVESGWIFCV